MTLLCDASADDATLIKSLGGIDEVYVEYTGTFPAPFVALNDGYLHKISDDTTPGSQPESIYINGGSSQLAELIGADLAALTAGTHIIAVHLKISTDTLVATLDGTDYDFSGNGYFTTAGIAQLDAIRFGLMMDDAFAAAQVSYDSIKIGTTGPGSSDIIADDFTTDFSLWDGHSGDVTISGATSLAPEGISFAPDDTPLTVYPTWVRLDDPAFPARVVSYTIDRGRQFELERTDAATATIRIVDLDGTLDPTNSSSDYFARIQPLVPVAISRWDPVAAEWNLRFRGVIEDWAYTVDPSGTHMQLEISCVGLFAILSAIQMQPGVFGDEPPAGKEGQIFFDNNTVGPTDDTAGRIPQIMGNAGIPDAMFVSFSGNVELWETDYSAGESAMTPVQEAADSEFPGVSNVYEDRFGRLVFHGRLAKMDTAGVLVGVDASVWDYHEWKIGDGAAVAASPSDTVQLRQFAFTRGLSQIVNQVLSYPKSVQSGSGSRAIKTSDLPAQLVSDDESIGLYGIRSETYENLLTKRGLIDDSDALTETKRFAQFLVTNYSAARNRPTLVGVRPNRPDAPGAAELHQFLGKCDISDLATLYIDHPGGGGFGEGESFFIEGIHEQVNGRIRDGIPDRAEGYDDVTLTLDLSPKAYWDNETGIFPEPS